MGGFHFIDLIVIVVIGLLILGPKMIQSIAHDAGKAAGHVKKTKDQVLAELPLEEIAKMTQKIPTSPQKAIQILITPEKPAEAKQKIQEEQRSEVTKQEQS